MQKLTPKDHKIDIRKNVRAMVIVPLVFMIPLEYSTGWKLTSSLYWRLFGLNENSTVEDYRTASTNDFHQFQAKICVTIPCLDEIDFKCGFGYYDETKFYELHDAILDCTYSNSFKVLPNTQIKNLILYCGKEHANVSNIRSVNTSPVRCEKIGGVWGQMSPYREYIRWLN